MWILSKILTWIYYLKVWVVHLIFYNSLPLLSSKAFCTRHWSFTRRHYTQVLGRKGLSHRNSFWFQEQLWLNYKPQHLSSLGYCQYRMNLFHLSSTHWTLTLTHRTRVQRAEYLASLLCGQCWYISFQHIWKAQGRNQLAYPKTLLFE